MKPATGLELWGHCRTCARWFLVSASASSPGNAAAWTCPACAQTLHALEHRIDLSGRHATRQLAHAGSPPSSWLG